MSLPFISKPAVYQLCSSNGNGNNAKLWPIVIHNHLKGSQFGLWRTLLITKVTFLCYEWHCERQKGSQYCERQTALLISPTAYLCYVSKVTSEWKNLMFSKILSCSFAGKNTCKTSRMRLWISWLSGDSNRKTEPESSNVVITVQMINFAWSKATAVKSPVLPV